MLKELPEELRVKIRQVEPLNPVDAALNKLSGIENTRKLIQWMAAEDEAPAVPVPGLNRHTSIKGL